MTEGKHLKQLGSQKTEYLYNEPSAEILETFDNKHIDRIYLVPFSQSRDEFTSLCISGETLLDIVCNEYVHPKGIPIKDLVGTEGLIFGFDLETKQPVVRRFHSVRKTQTSVPVIKINLEHFSSDGQGNIKKIPKQIVVTPDHLLLVSTGWGKFTWIKAASLKPGVRLIADQRSIDTIREKARHRLIMECLLDRYLNNVELVHHIDHRHLNNSPENLEIKDSATHFSHHQFIRYGYNKSLPSIEQLVEMYNSGLYNFNSLAKKFDCDASTIESRIGHLVNRRTQRESLLAKPESLQLRKAMLECREFYEKGYTLCELGDFYQVHLTTIMQWIDKSGGETRTSLETKKLRKTIDLPSLNHQIISVESEGIQDVYNLEVEGIENFFGDGVVMHNCPVTNQSDHARMEMIYIPNHNMVESKSLKLYLFSFRNHGEFHEDVINRISNDLWNLMNPKYLRVFGNFAPRGGISIKPLVELWEKELGASTIHRIERLVNSWDRKSDKE